MNQNLKEIVRESVCVRERARLSEREGVCVCVREIARESETVFLLLPHIGHPGHEELPRQSGRPAWRA